MEEKNISVITRRDFIRRAACAAVGTVAMTSSIRDLRLMNAAVAQSNMSGYKALVCIFLQGGNDSNNMIIPTDPADYASYAGIRTPVLAIPSSAILSLNYTDSAGHSYGLHPACPELTTLFGEGKVAFMLNTGTLVTPINNRTNYLNALYAKPPQLFFPCRPADPMADIHSRPAAHDRLGRALRRPVEFGPSRRAHFNVRFAGGVQYF